MSQFKRSDTVRILPNISSVDARWIGLIVKLCCKYYHHWETVGNPSGNEDEYILLKEGEFELISHAPKQVAKKDIKRIKDWLGISHCAGDLSLKIAATDLRTIYNALDELYALRAENED